MIYQNNIKKNDHETIQFTIYGYENIDPKAINQFFEAVKQPFVQQAALMPDAHLGYGLPIGGVVSTHQYVVPSWVGYDIGCGMCAYRTNLKKTEVAGDFHSGAPDMREIIYKKIMQKIPVGFRHQAQEQEWSGFNRMDKTQVFRDIFNEKKGFTHLGTLGALGNHFIELGFDEKDQVWVIVHSGSRGVGHGIGSYYMAKAANSDKPQEGSFGVSLSTALGQDYMIDVQFCQNFALENRIHMLKTVLNILSTEIKEQGLLDYNKLINRHHNHVEKIQNGLLVHRKGATHADKGLKGVIPGSMQHGVYIVEGKGNPDSLCSSSHGAGRKMSCSQAKKKLNLEDFEEQMKGIYADVSQRTISESSGSYKNIHEVISEQEDLIHVLHYIQPLLNVKG